jgi:hypothetical protein
MENHGFGHQTDLIIGELYTATFSLTLHSSKKADTARRPKAECGLELPPNRKRRIKTIFNHFRNRHARSTTAANTTSKEHAALQKAKDRQFNGFQRDELVAFLQMIHQVQLQA